MSQIYNLEPPTKGKVVLHTTHGDIEIELWPKEAPKAVRNFAQLCMEGYYDGVIFHRIIKDFIVQTGDPTGTGSGGESIYQRPFKSEFHSRLKFSHRGLVACANTNNQIDTNGSQFFITLERCDHLDWQSTIFGRVAGDTIFNVVRLAEVDVDERDRPVDPPRILSSDVLWPPFDDIVPRTTAAERAAAAKAAADEAKRQELLKRKKTGKKLNVLSFGDEAEDDEAELEAAAQGMRFRSAHETLEGDARLESAAVGVHDEHVQQLQERLTRERAQQAELDAAAARKAAEDAAARAGEGGAEAFADRMRQKVHARGAAAREQERGVGGPAAAAAADEADADDSDGSGGSGPEGGDAPAKRQKMDKLHLSKEGKGAAAARKKRAEVVDAELLTQYQLSLARFKQRKRSKGDREKGLMSKLTGFRSRLKTKHAAAAGAAGDHPACADGKRDVRFEPDPTTVGEAGYSGKVNKDIDHRSYLPAAWRIDSYLDESDGDEDDLQGLRRHKLTWNAEDQVADPTKRRDDVDDYVVVDPLLEAGKAKFNKQQQAAKKRQNEWAGKVNL